jgi:inosose dehydratase
MVEAGQGGVDFEAIRNILEANNFDGWAIVEQDMNPAPTDKPFPIAQRTLRYLQEIGLS